MVIRSDRSRIPLQRFAADGDAIRRRQRESGVVGPLVGLHHVARPLPGPHQDARRRPIGVIVPGPRVAREVLGPPINEIILVDERICPDIAAVVAGEKCLPVGDRCDTGWNDVGRRAGSTGTVRIRTVVGQIQSQQQIIPHRHRAPPRLPATVGHRPSLESPSPPFLAAALPATRMECLTSIAYTH